MIYSITLYKHRAQNSRLLRLTFNLLDVSTVKWISELRRVEKLRGLLEQYDISWKFNLNRAPLGGRQFERLIAVVKLAMFKVIGGAKLTWTELSDVLDVETQINRRPIIQKNEI